MAAAQTKLFDTPVFSNAYATELPSLHSSSKIQPLAQMRLAMVNRAHALSLGFSEDWCQGQVFLEQLLDAESRLNRHSVAQKYGGHQFGRWNPMLGDGRGILLAEVLDCNNSPIDLHLKGAGITPYSRHADGRAVLRSTLREYIASEALHHLGVPSSRALCLFTSEQAVYRESTEIGAMMIRTAPSHIRFGHFEYCFYQKDSKSLNALFEHVLHHHFPHFQGLEQPERALLNAIVTSTAKLIAHWQSVGFVHGVMNTDNMSIHGISFDYGPFAFIERYQADALFNHSDAHGRYAFDQQPTIGLWNLNALARAFSGKLSVEDIKHALLNYEPIYLQTYQQLMLEKLGFSSVNPTRLKLLQGWLAMLEKQRRDFTLSFRRLSLASIKVAHSTLRDDFLNRTEFDEWWHAYRAERLADKCADQEAVQSLMLSVNPVLVPRTHLLQQAIEHASKNDFTFAEDLINALKKPFSSAYDGHIFSLPDEQASSAKLSCSS